MLYSKKLWTNFQVHFIIFTQFRWYLDMQFGLLANEGLQNFEFCAVKNSKKKKSSIGKSWIQHKTFMKTRIQQTLKFFLMLHQRLMQLKGNLTQKFQFTLVNKINKGKKWTQAQNQEQGRVGNLRRKSFISTVCEKQLWGKNGQGVWGKQWQKQHSLCSSCSATNHIFCLYPNPHHSPISQSWVLLLFFWTLYKKEAAWSLYLEVGHMSRTFLIPQLPSHLHLQNRV